MSILKKFDAIIVGQGISGTMLSTEFIKNKKTCLVIDEQKANTSSKVMAGVYNPIVFKRVVKSWLIDDLLPVAEQSYRYIESCCNASFLSHRKIIKVFVNDEEKKLWLSKAEQPELTSYLEKEVRYDTFNEGIKPHQGFAFVKKAGQVNVQDMLLAWKQFLEQKESYLASRFEYDQLQLNKTGVQYQNYLADYVIFCEGYHARFNPFFPNLPFVPAKGEVLTLKIEGLDTEQHILNKGVFMLPLSKNLYKVGATYVWDKIDEETTAEGYKEITEKLEKIINTPFTVVNQQAGIRPSSKDRRPFVGVHPQIPQMGILNGMGTKAVLLAPYFSKELFEHLYYNKKIHPEASINRL